MPYPLLTLDVFTDRPFAGNPLGLVLDADDLDTATMQRIAAEIGYSETAFVRTPSDPTATAALRIFTPGLEVPFAGHPTVGTTLGLAHAGRIHDGHRGHFEVPAGSVPIALDGDTATVTAPVAFTAGTDVDPATVAAVLGLQVAAIRVDRHRPCLISAGLQFLAIELADLDQLAAARIDPAAYDRHVAAGGEAALHLYCDVGFDGAVRHLRTRMFDPAAGVPEDPATGSASLALAGLLASRAGTAGSHAFILDQGIEMGRQGRIRAVAEHDGTAVVRLDIQGEAVVISQGQLIAV